MTFRTKHNLAGDHVHTMDTGYVLGRQSSGEGPIEQIAIGSLGGGGGGVSDHGALTGLADDDHTQYHNNARGDARYSQLGHAHAHADLTGLTADDHPRYGLTEAASAPGSPYVGQRWVDTDTGIHYTYSANASAWVEWH